jgi:hypothetical protein
MGSVIPRLDLGGESWTVRPALVEGVDVVAFGGVKVGEIFWVRELRWHSTARELMAQGLNGLVNSAGYRTTWTARCVPDPVDGAEVWSLLHNGLEVGEVHWILPDEQPTEDLLRGLNTIVRDRRGHEWVVEPLPLSKAS